MSTNFPYRNSIWDHRKGAIDAETREYVAAQNEIANDHGVKLTYFLVASALEQEDIGYLRAAVQAGHEIGNHTYSHVNVTAKATQELRGVYGSRSWLVGQRDVRTVICDEIATASVLIREKLGVTPRGFRTPYGFSDGLENEGWFRQFLRANDFAFVSSRYFGWDLWDEQQSERGVDDVRLLTDLRSAQPYIYSDGLVEFPIATPSDCHVFRPWRWPLQRWLETVKRLIDLSYEHGFALDLCLHPSILAACDPGHLTITTVIAHARSKNDGVWFATLSELVGREGPFKSSSSHSNPLQVVDSNLPLETSE
jgi:peptidoglycan/xylan/chitin deacetylase (PgdA/CDA1 family)